LGLLVPLLGVPSVTRAQAWVPAKGEGNLTLTYQDGLQKGHLRSDGERPATAACCDPVRMHKASLDIEYGLTDSLAVVAQVPYITARYGGPNPHIIDRYGQPNNPQDDGAYHGAVQDLRFGARFNLTASPLMITPFADVIVPSHRYETRAHATIGLDKRALVLGVNLGRFLDPILPRGFFQAQIAHALVQDVIGYRGNRTTAVGEIGYFITPRLAARVAGSLQLTHDGIYWENVPTLAANRELALQHDRLLRSNFFNFGVALSFAVNQSWDVSATYGDLVWGESTTPERRFAVSVNWHFRTGRAAPPAPPDPIASAWPDPGAIASAH
jgi:hypothetical protein